MYLFVKTRCRIRQFLWNLDLWKIETTVNQQKLHCMKITRCMVFSNVINNPVNYCIFSPFQRCHQVTRVQGQDWKIVQWRPMIWSGWSMSYNISFSLAGFRVTIWPTCKNTPYMVLYHRCKLGNTSRKRLKEFQTFLFANIVLWILNYSVTNKFSLWFSYVWDTKYWNDAPY